ncbi:LTA synthase family protein [Oscillibacter sp.]|uniref:LTA synthase family protein n=1 Tax=Oscillibacter sp. TaxID=1945593 RepID=UPI00289F7756|nr:LTA synthase family protein [Oscillibacter sp.]
MRQHTKPLPARGMGLPLTFLLAVLLTGFYTLLCLWIQPNSLRSALSLFLTEPLLIVLNALPIGLLIVAFAILFANVFFSAALVGTLCGILSIANRIKIEVRNEPLFPRDLGLLKEAGSAAGSYAIRFPWPAIAAVVISCALLVALGIFFRGRPLSPGRPIWIRFLLRFSGAVITLGALMGLIFTVYASNSLYNSFPVSNSYYVPSVFNELGFSYCFTHHFTTYTVDKPAGFSRAAAEEWDSGNQAPGQGAPVNVIMVMNEAFSDVTDQPMFTYPAEENPLKNLHAIRESAHAVSGHVVVPGFAGGTANTEFDVLTGMQTNALSATTTSAFRAVNRNLDSLYRVFAADGYATSFLHPGDAWFYNRENVYDFFGAEKIEFAEDMPDLAYKGRWVTDDSLAGLIEENFEAAVTAGKPLFNYTTTIQNHMSYTADKYGADYAYPPMQTSAPLSDQAKELLSVYIEGARDADAMLGRLTDYFAASSEPVVLVFLGDHLPYLGDNQLAYKELGMNLTPEENGSAGFLKSYETPYVIWANDTAAEALDWDASVAAVDLPEDGTISASFLGATVLELTGRGDESPWFQFLNQLRRTAYSVVQKGTAVLPDGTVTTLDALDQSGQELLSKWRCWSYYKLKYKDVS